MSVTDTLIRVFRIHIFGKISDFHKSRWLCHAATIFLFRSTIIHIMSQSYWNDDAKDLYDVKAEEWLTVLRCNGFVDTMECDCQFPIGYGRRLGEALLCNTRMDELMLRVSELVAASDIKIPGIKMDVDYSYQYSSEERKKISDEVENQLTPLLQYLSTSNVLKVLTLKNGFEDNDNGCFNQESDLIEDSVLAAVYKNLGLASLTYAIRMWSAPLARYLSTTQRLTHLSFKLTYCRLEDDDGDGRALIDAFAANQSLTHLTLFRCTERNRSLVDKILLRLAAHQKLLSLYLESSDGSKYEVSTPPEELFALLRSNGSHLKELGLDGFTFANKEWERFSTALQLSSVQSLSIGEKTYFDEESTRDFAQSRHLCRLLVAAPNEYHYRNVFDGAPFGEVVSHLMTNDNGLEDLTIQYPYDEGRADKLHGYFCAVVERSRNIRLHRLSLWLSTPAELQDLALCLAGSIHLREIDIVIYEGGKDMTFAPQIFAAVRENGSLYSVDINFMNEPIFDALMQTKLQAYFQRNRKLSGLLPGSQMYQSGAENYCIVSHLYPALLVISKALGSLRSTVFLALLSTSTGNSIGPMLYRKHEMLHDGMRSA
jgi:hypothetical protein